MCQPYCQCCCNIKCYRHWWIQVFAPPSTLPQLMLNFQGVWRTIVTSYHLRTRHTSGRTYLNPYGHTNFPFVEDGNTLACRSILLILVAHWRGLRWLLEQPDGSFLQRLPRFQWLLRVIKAAVCFHGEKILYDYDEIMYIYI